MNNLTKIEIRVIQAAEAALHQQNYVSSIDVFIGMGLLQPIHVEDWRKGKIPYLEKEIQGNASKINSTLECFHKWASEKSLKPTKIAYLIRARASTKTARYSINNDPSIEDIYRTHYISPLLSEKKQQQLKETLEKPPELIAYIIVSDSQCSQCNKVLTKGNFLFMEANHPLCLSCAGFSSFVFLPSGDAKTTRLARKHSAQSLIVVKFSRARKRYERQGLLISEDAYQKANDLV